MERGAVPYFFFSYARNDSKVDSHLRDFYDDLCKELFARGSIKLEETGFFDINQQTGTNWPTVAGEAVGNAKVFVPVYSSWYFGSETCGREWNGFARRLEQHRIQTGETLASILPVWWVPPTYRPDATKDMHDTRDQFGSTYRENGLRSLMTRGMEPEYRAFVEKFALQVLEAGRMPPRPLSGINLRTEPNAFARQAPTTTAPAAQFSGPKKVNFVVAAGTSAEMRAVRESLEAYGETWDDWKPYLPRCSDPVVLQAQTVAVERRLISEPAAVDHDLIPMLDKASKRSELVVLIIDPWVVGIEHYRARLEELENKRYKNVAILLPGDENEPRLLPDGVDAGDVLRMCIGDWLDDQPRRARQDLGTAEKFEEALKHTLIDIGARIVNHGQVARRVQQGGASSRPVLVGPEG
ncbi:TIR-like protein FxsC [Lentzea sp. NPDC051213]|uniref:TIR-like protein FxsC n=1 Tax=Lentzea sp. NPDC051213 TaxID=3364126 RepID=UPI0037A23B4B